MYDRAIYSDTTRWRCSACALIYESEEEAQDCCAESNVDRVYRCQSCEYRYTTPEEAYLCCSGPAYVCGSCNDEWSDEDDALGCCNPEAQELAWQCTVCGHHHEYEVDAHGCCPTELELAEACVERADRGARNHDAYAALELQRGNVSGMLCELRCVQDFREQEQKYRDAATALKEAVKPEG